MEIFKDYAYYYNTFYDDKDYKKEAIQIDRLLKKYGKGYMSVIDFGCGTGKHDIEFVKMGYHCAGIDLSPFMIDIAKKNARQENLDIDFSIADVRSFKTKSKYDAVFSLFHVMSYQNKNQDVLSAFKSARSALNQDGLFIFDVWYGPGVLCDKPVVRVKEIENKRNRLVRIAKPIMHDKENVVDVCYELFVIDKELEKVEVISEVHSMRYFFKPELEFLLREAEFELIDNLDCQTLDTTNYKSWTSYFIAKAV